MGSLRQPQPDCPCFRRASDMKVESRRACPTSIFKPLSSPLRNLIRPISSIRRQWRLRAISPHSPMFRCSHSTPSRTTEASAAVNSSMPTLRIALIVSRFGAYESDGLIKR
jgi:hypothetical protein